MIYRHTQHATLIILLVLVPIAVIAAIGWRTTLHPVAWIVLAILAVTLAVFRSLTIEIDAEELRCRFGDGLIRRRFPLSEIVAAEPVRNKWYYGWGVRITPSGWMFNVSGLDAVEITLASGRKFRIGTDRPQEVIEALRRASPID